MSHGVFTRNVCHCFHFTNYYFYCSCSSDIPQIWDAFQREERQCPFYPQTVTFEWGLWGWGVVPALFFSSLTRANVFGMSKRVPNTRLVSLVGREVPSCACILCCPPNADAQSIFPGALPLHLSLRGPGFSQPTWIPSIPSLRTGEIQEDCTGWICVQARRGQSGLVSGLCLKQKTQAKVNSRSGGE